MSDAVLQSVVRLTRERDSEALVRSVLEAIAELTPARYVVMYGACDDQPDTFDRALAVTATDELERPRVPAWNAPASSATGDPCLLECLSADRPVVHVRDRDVRHLFPVRVAGNPLGVLEVVSDAEFAKDHHGLVKGFLAVYGNYLSLLDEGSRDKLTGLLNRRTFDERLARLLRAQALRCDASRRRRIEQGQPVRRPPVGGDSVARLGILDIDHFKRINDTFGHAYGDEVLLTVAQLLRACFRKTDLLFRFGGEEFVVILEPTTTKDAFMVFERARMALESHVFHDVGSVTMSIGFAALGSSEYPPKVLERADRALYFAKDHGRNGTYQYEELLASGALTEVSKTGSIDLF